MVKTIEVPKEEFDVLMYWLERCEDKGHLENCYDLVEPFAKFAEAYYNLHYPKTND